MLSSLPTLLTLTTILSLTKANPIQPRPQHPYFAVRAFTFSKSTTSSRYTFNVTFPQDVVITPSLSSSAAYTIPGFTTPVPCTGTYFYSPSESETVTLINACGMIGDDWTTQKVSSKLDVGKGVLYLEYMYNATSSNGGGEEDFVWNATQTGLEPVDAGAMEGFNTPATGPGVSD